MGDPTSEPTQIRPAERDRAGASIGGDHQSPSRKARKFQPSPSLLSERRTDPAERPTDAPGRLRFDESVKVVGSRRRWQRDL